MVYRGFLRRYATVYAVVFMAFALVGCGQQPSAKRELLASSGSSAPQPCPDSAELSCYNVAMPLDHQDPQGKTINVAFAVHPARGHKLGALLIPGGGPGESSILNLGKWLPTMDSRIKDAYDIVTFDLRGAFLSGGLDCNAANYSWIFTPQRAGTPEDAARLAAAAERFALDCTAEMGIPVQELAFYNTVQMVRDVEDFRLLLNYDPWAVFTYSYGTQFAQVYAQTFPQSMRFLGIDGSVDLTVSATLFDQQLNEDQNSLLMQSFGLCATQANCQGLFKSSARESYDRLQAKFLQEGDQQVTLHNSDNTTEEHTMSAYDLDFTASTAVATPAMRAILMKALAAYDAMGDLEAMFRLSDGTHPDLAAAGLRAGDAHGGMSSGIYYAFICNDYGRGGTDGPRQAGDFIGAMKGFEKDPARIRSAAYHELPCAFWPSAPSAAFEPKVFSPSDIPVMMIAAHGDGAVPYRQSETLFSRLKSGVFIEVDGGKHISYGYGNNCIDQPVTDFILSGTLPAGGRIRCENGFFDAKLLPVISASAP